MIGIFDKKPDTDANFKAWLDENVNISQNLSKHDKSKHCNFYTRFRIYTLILILVLLIGSLIKYIPGDHLPIRKHAFRSLSFDIVLGTVLLDDTLATDTCTVYSGSYKTRSLSRKN